LVDHHEAEGAALARQRLLRVVAGDALAAALFPIAVDVSLEPRRLGGPDDFRLREIERELLGAGANDGRTSEQDRAADLLVGDDLCCAQRLVVLPLGEDDARVGGFREPEDLAHDLSRGIDAPLELVAVFVEIDGLRGHARVDGRLGDRGRDPEEHALVEGLRDDVRRPEADRAQAVRFDDALGDVLARERGERVGGGELHFVVDRVGAHVEGAAEDVRIAEHVVHLVRVVAAARGDDRVGPRGRGELVRDLGIGVGEREDDGPRGHLLQHRAGHEVGGGEPDEKVLSLDGLVDRAKAGVDGEGALVRIHLVRASGVDDAELVEHRDVLAPNAELDPELHAADGRGARAEAQDFQVGELLFGDESSVEERCAGDDRRAVLIVVEHRNLHPALELLFDVKALGRLDVLEVDGAEGGLERGDRLDEAIGVLGVELEVEDVDVGEPLEEEALAFHDRLGGVRADVAEAEHGRAVGDDGDQVAACGVLVDERAVGGDLQRRLGDSGRIGERQIALRRAGLGGNDLDFPGASERVVLEGVLAPDHGALN
jgi:hypothetical protein